MKKINLKMLTASIAISLSLLCHSFNVVAADDETKEATVKEAGNKEAEKPENKNDSLMERIDFGNSYILGQSIKSGAVYLLHRKKSDIKSMLETRENYRKEILEDFKVNDENDDN